MRKVYGRGGLLTKNDRRPLSRIQKYGGDPRKKRNVGKPSKKGGIVYAHSDVPM